MWTLTAEGLLGCLAGGSNENAVLELDELMLPQELKSRAAPPSAMGTKKRIDVFIG
jgi:hypothetical protein